jgi:phage shock protein B
MPTSVALVALGTIFMVFVAPLWLVFHFITQSRKARHLSGDDEKVLDALWQSARRMEGRIEALEKVLDSEAPGWRRRAGG